MPQQWALDFSFEAAKRFILKMPSDALSQHMKPKEEAVLSVMVGVSGSPLGLCRVSLVAPV